jgi:tRNA threonylcarbamoyladenosine biosynthesis protein TsaB
MLFIDSTYDLTLGLLADDLNWLDLRHHKGQKSSAILQKEIYEMCLASGLKANEVKGLITIAGPGFYTGLRLSEGFADIFKFLNIPCFSFYSYEIPSFLGRDKGVWMTKAYRGEYFFHHWSGSDSKNVLITSSELPGYLEKIEEVFIHSASSLDELALKHIRKYKTTYDLMRVEAPGLFQKVIEQKLSRESFYFRAPEDEFRVSP